MLVLKEMVVSTRDCNQDAHAQTPKFHRHLFPVNHPPFNCTASKAFALAHNAHHCHGVTCVIVADGQLSQVRFYSRLDPAFMVGDSTVSM